MVQRKKCCIVDLFSCVAKIRLCLVSDIGAGRRADLLDEAGYHCPGKRALVVLAMESLRGVGRWLRLSCLQAVASSKHVGQKLPDPAA